MCNFHCFTKLHKLGKRKKTIDFGEKLCGLHLGAWQPSWIVKIQPGGVALVLGYQLQVNTGKHFEVIG
jgi:hypothetical protein